MRFSTVSRSVNGLPERSSASEHPVHAWNDSQITDGRALAASACANAFAAVPEMHNVDAVMAANLRKERRDTPWLCNESNTVT